ncbi:zinc-dependent alcohol dehydrogenase [Desulfothermus okinawensis]
MFAIILEDKKSIKIKKIPIPENISNNYTLMEVMYCGICRTDVKLWEKGHRDLILPRIPGHEIVGREKDKQEIYVVWPGDCCEKCNFCRAGRENLCDNIKIIGFHRDGGFAQFVSVPKKSLIKIPKDVPPQVAVLAEPIGCVINAISKIKGGTLLVVGAGIMGLLCCLCAREYGYTVYLYDIDEERINKSKEIQNKLNIISLKDSQNKFDSVINATSTYTGFENSLNFLKKGGVFCFFSAISNLSKIPVKIINELHYKEITLIGSYGCRKMHMEMALEIIQNNQEILKRTITRFINPKEVETAFYDIIHKKAFKIVLNWQEVNNETLS